MSNKKNSFLILILFSLVLTAALSPIASNEYFPDYLDFAIHSKYIWQARLAIEQGQFPIRTAPTDFNQQGSPFFQFYSPFAYTVAGIINKFIFTENPYITYKLAIWLSLLVGGFYFYLLMKRLLKSDVAALLAALVYIIAPYVLINVDVRGDYTEAFSQGILPVVLYYSFHLYYESFTFSRLFKNALSWALLAMSSVITYVYASFYLGLIFLLLSLFSYQKKISWKKLAILGAAFFYGCLLAAWYILPAALIHNSFRESFTFANEYSFLTKLSTLLSLKPISPVPQSVTGIKLPGPLYPSVGVPILIAVGIILFVILFDKKYKFFQSDRKLLIALLSVFFLAFFATWTPFNFWQYLPNFLTITQFSYRQLTHVSWIGAMLFGFALCWLFKYEFDRRHLILGLIVILGYYGNCLESLTGSRPTNTYKEVLDSPSYLFKQAPKYWGNSEILLQDSDGWLQKNREATVVLGRAVDDKSNLQLKIKGTNPQSSEETAQLMINDIVVATKQIPPGDFAWSSYISSAFKTPTKNIKIKIETSKYFIPHQIDPKNADSREIGIKLNSVMISGLPPEESVQSVVNCHNEGTEKICAVKILQGNVNLQLPVLYYPHMLSIKVNGKESEYFATTLGDFTLATIKLRPGNYSITSTFRGMPVANLISAVSFIALFFGILIDMRKYFKSVTSFRTHRSLDEIEG